MCNFIMIKRKKIKLKIKDFLSIVVIKTTIQIFVIEIADR